MKKFFWYLVAAIPVSLFIGLGGYFMGYRNAVSNCSEQYVGGVGVEHLVVLRKAHQDLVSVPASTARVIVEGGILREILFSTKALEHSRLEKSDFGKYERLRRALENKIDYAISNHLLQTSGFEEEPWKEAEWKLDEPWFVEPETKITGYLRKLFEDHEKLKGKH